MKRGDLQEYNHVEDIVVFLSWKVFYTDNISNASYKQEMRESHSQMKILIRQNFKWFVVNLALETLLGGSLEMSRTVHLIFQNPGGFPVNLFGQQLLNTAGRFKGSVHQNKERTRKLWNKKTTFILKLWLSNFNCPWTWDTAILQCKLLQCNCCELNSSE